MKIRTLILIAIISLVITIYGCSSLNSVATIKRESLYAANENATGTLFSVNSDATRRVGFVFVDKDGKMKALLEPPPDAVAAAVSNLTAKLGVSKVTAEATDAITKTNDILASRGIIVELQRGQLFQLSLLYFSDALNKDQVKEELDKIIDSSKQLTLMQNTSTSNKAILDSLETIIKNMDDSDIKTKLLQAIEKAKVAK